MTPPIAFVKYSFLAGAASVAAARARDLSLGQVVLSFPLGVAVYLVTTLSKAGQSWTLSNFSQ